MAAIVWDPDVIAGAASLSAVASEEQDGILETVNAFFNVRVWGGEDAPKLKRARIYMARHLGELVLRALAGAAGGAVSSETIGASSFSIAYEQLAQDADVLKTTSHGQALLALRGSNPKARIPGAL